MSSLNLMCDIPGSTDLIDNMEDLNRLTLELFTNKTQYNKYLSKHNPKAYQELEEYRQKIQSNKIILEENMLSMLNSACSLKSSSSFLSSRENNIISSSVQDAFDILIKELLKDIEMNNTIYERKESYGEEEEEEETLFGNIETSTPTYSFWSGDRILRQPTQNDNFLPHYPTNTTVFRRNIGKKK